MKLIRKDGKYMKGKKVVGQVPAEQLALEEQAEKFKEPANSEVKAPAPKTTKK